MRVTRLRLVVSLVFAAFVVVGCRDSGRSSPHHDGRSFRHPRVILLAVDGLEPSLVKRLVAGGEMPNVANLIQAGTFATIDCVVTLESPVVWTSVATGRRPEAHGITGFTVDDVPVTSTVRRAPAFWNLLPRWDLQPATIGWLATWPAEADSGIMVTQRAWWGKFKRKVSPEGVIDTARYDYRGLRHRTPVFLSRFTDYPFDPRYKDLPQDSQQYAINFLLDKRLIGIHVHDGMMTEIARDVVDHHDVDVLAVYLQGADYTGHGFWKWFDPEPFRKAGWKIPDREVQQLGQIIPRYYQYLDRLIGKIVKLGRPGALVILLSDHGFGPALGGYKTRGDFLSGNHRPEATLVVSGAPVLRGGEVSGRITHLDILPTLLWALHLPVSEELPGRPLEALFTPAFRSAHAIHRVKSYGTMQGSGFQAETSPEDAEILRELRSLGYIQ